MSKADRGLDRAALGAFLTAELGASYVPRGVRQFATGQSNPTYLVSTEAAPLVLRRKPFGPLLKSAHAIDREYRVQSALWPTAVPVPQMLAYCEDPAMIGAEFYVMEFVDGRTFDDPRLEGLSSAERTAVYDEMNRVLAEIHRVDVAAAGLDDYGRAGNYVRRQIDRWTRQYRATETGTIAPMDDLIEWLNGNVPPDDGRASLVHGDFRIDNLLFAADAPRCLAVLDWELSTIGHPFADLAALLMQWRLPTGSQGRGLKGVPRQDYGLPSDAAFVEAYCRRVGIAAIPDISFYVAFAFFRMAAILQGVKKRGLDGNAANPERAAEFGESVPLYAAGGLDAATGGTT